jgi:hypothetical protein
MIGKLIRAEVGRRVAGRVAGTGNGMRGALIGVAAPFLLKRISTRTGLVIAGAYAAKKLYDKKRKLDRSQVRLGQVTRSAPATGLQSAPPLQPTEPKSSTPA